MVLQNCDTSDDSKKKSATQHQYDEIEQVYAVLRPTLVMLVAARQHVCFREFVTQLTLKLCAALRAATGLIPLECLIVGISQPHSHDSPMFECDFGIK